MKTLTVLRSILLIAAVMAGVQLRGESAAPQPSPHQPDELTIVIVESLSGATNESYTYERLARVFTEAFDARKWPLKIETERLAANARAHPLEMRVFFQSIKSETPGSLTFRGWVTFQDHATKHDFGVIRYEYYPRAGRNFEDELDATIRGAADIAVNKVGSILYPSGSPKP